MLLTQGLWWQIQPTVYQFFLSAVAISSWYGGIGPGLLATALSALASKYFFIPPVYSLIVNWHSLVRVVYFVLVALLIASLNAMLRSAQLQAQRERELLLQNQEKLHQSEERYRSMVERVRDYAIFMLDPDGCVINWNVGAERIFGYQEEEIIGQPWECFFTPEAIRSGRPKQVLETAITEGLSQENRRHIRKDSTQFWASCVVTPLWERDGNLRGFSEVIQDITERKRVESEREQLLISEQSARSLAEAANRSKDEFLAIVSHELRTPMTAIIGWAGMLQAGKLDRFRTALAVQTIERNANLQMQLIDDLLDISRIVRGDILLNCCTVELDTVITSAIEAVQSAADAKAIQLESVLNPLVGRVWGDPNRLQQVACNLLSNAIKFTPSGGRVEVQLSAIALNGREDRRQEEESSQLLTTNNQLPITSYAQIQVTDTGIGISPDFLPYVFDRFRQANSTSMRLHKGLGLGLAIARHLVELHGGTIQAESLGKGQGATFTVKLPISGAREDFYSSSQPLVPSPSSSPSLSAKRSPSLEGLRVLVVDDEADMRMLLCIVLEECKAEVTAISSVDEAIDLLEHSKPDVLISDIGMPNKDGYLLLRHVKQIEAETGVAIPAIALTVYARKEDRTKALLAGFHLHIAKPVDPDELIAAIASLAKQSKRL